MGGNNRFLKAVGVVVIALLPFFLEHIGERRKASANETEVTSSSVTAQESAQAARPSAEMVNLQESFIRISEQVKPAVVNISTIFEEKSDEPPQYEFYFGSPFEDFFEDFFNQAPKKRPRSQEQPSARRFAGTGSGVIIDPRGYILTNEHVVRGAKNIKVTLSNDKKYRGKVVGMDGRTDIAIIKIRAGRELPYARLGDSKRIRVGEWAIAIGSPFGLEETVTTGVISAVRQSLLIEGKEYRDLIQTDAAINRGNSGGPLCNIRGEIIGINTAIYAPTGVFSGVGFSIPVNSAKDIIDDLINKGRVVRGWLGVEIRPVDEAIAKNFALPEPAGVLINGVLPGSPAEKAGLKRGDVVFAVDGKAVQDVRALQAIISQTKPWTPLELSVMRDGKEISVSLTAGQMPSEEEAEAPDNDGEEENVARDETPSALWQGMKAVTFTDALARQFELAKHEKGCIVLNIEQGSVAEEMGLLPGDLIISVNRLPTPTVRELQAAVARTRVEDGIVLDINRQGRSIYLSFTPGK